VDSRIRHRCRRRVHHRPRAVPIEEPMLKGVLGKVFGTRHERERRRIQPIVDEINEHYARLQGVPDEELRGQTAKFRSIIRERTHELEEEVARLKAAKKTTSDPSEREQVDNELSGADGRGGVEA